MKRASILATLVLAAGGAGLFFLVSRGGGEPEPPNPAEPEEAAEPDPASGGAAGAPPELPAESEGQTASGDEARLASRGDYVEYRGDGGGRIRDHRNRDVAVDPETPVRRPFKSLDIEPKLVASMGRELRAVARRCQQAHASEVGEAARVQPRVSFEIREGRLAITGAELALRNITEGGEFAACMSSASIGLTIDAPDHPEVERHSMMVPIDLDRR